MCGCCDDDRLVLVVLLLIVVVVLVAVVAVVGSCQTEFISRVGVGGGGSGSEDADLTAAPLVGGSTKFRGCCVGGFGGGGDSRVRFLLLRIDPSATSPSSSTTKGIVDPSLCRVCTGVVAVRVGDGSISP